MRDVGFDLRVTVGGHEGGRHLLAGHAVVEQDRDAVSPGAILLPNSFYASYVALGRQLVGMKPGATFRVVRGAAGGGRRPRSTASTTIA